MEAAVEKGFIIGSRRRLLNRLPECYTRMRFKFLTIVLVNVVIIVAFFYHEKFLTALDGFIMPNSAELCKVVSYQLTEKLKLNHQRIPLEEIEHELKDLKLSPGGKYVPAKNVHTYKTAIIIPYRNRLRNLELLMRNLHPFLVAQSMHYQIFVMEPLPHLSFNKGTLMNAGFLEALKEDSFECIMFHDVDIIPEVDQNLYGCNFERPRLLATAISAYAYS